MGVVVSSDVVSESLAKLKILSTDLLGFALCLYGFSLCSTSFLAGFLSVALSYRNSLMKHDIVCSKAVGFSVESLDCLRVESSSSLVGFLLTVNRRNGLCVDL